MTKDKKNKENSDEERNTEKAHVKNKKGKDDSLEKSDEEKEKKKECDKKKKPDDSKRKNKNKSNEGSDKSDEDSDKEKKTKNRTEKKNRAEKKEDLEEDNSKYKRLKKADTDYGKASFVFYAQKDEVDMSVLPIDPAVQKKALQMEEYKIAMEQLLLLFSKIIRRGNDTTDFDNLKSEKGQTAPERLYKSIYQATAFWETASELQPELNEAIKVNTALIGAAERKLQENAPKHMKSIKKFVYNHYPQYCDMKKDFVKACKIKPENENAKYQTTKKIFKFIQEKFIDAKAKHFGDIQALIIDIGIYHKTCEMYWYHIGEKKAIKKPFVPEKFDFSQLYEKKK